MEHDKITRRGFIGATAMLPLAGLGAGKAEDSRELGIFNASASEKALAHQATSKLPPDCIRFGDLALHDRGDLGLDFYETDSADKIMFLNQGAELGLLELLRKK